MRACVLRRSTAALIANAPDTAIGILYIYDETQINSINTSLNLPDFGTPFYAISFSLNVLLTLMIVARLVLHDRSFRKITGTQATAGKVYKTVITILVESFALHAISFLLYMVPWAVGSSVTNIFYTTFTGIQVRTFFLLSHSPSTPQS